jgi:acetolactate synthase-1/2/3 large subunit
MYALQELVSARQAGVSASLLIVDDGGYGILRSYQQRAFGAEHGVELVRPDFLAAAAAFGVAARRTSPETLADDIRWSTGLAEPTVLVLEEVLRPPTTMD